ncbi:phosphatidylserine decarboxylase family protein [Veillonella magna]|jgi:phosphatidylserine decarboxylase|uniref:phosphatidylserine decarboxylase family protein n=1 Tax=Veillonella magna TaxID=464322 RepID=UPI00258F7691|nr:phosphatidylserine decarboxylase family protein [Veillonella magna]
MPTGIIVKEGYPFIGITFLVALLVGYFVSVYVAIIPFILACFFTFFFRSPKRQIPEDPNVLVSPADGKVMDVSEVYEDTFLGTECKKVTIFLSVFDVHVNRAPMAGRITFRQYTCGGFLPAYKSSVGYENERHSIGIDNGRISILVTQIAGLLARRIVSWTDLDSNLEKGQLYGMIKFGSCTELFVPKNVTICVKKGDHVKGGETIVGRLNDE